MAPCLRLICCQWKRLWAFCSSRAIFGKRRLGRNLRKRLARAGRTLYFPIWRPIYQASPLQMLRELTLEFAQRALHAQGALLAKYFHGSGYSQMVERFRRRFQSVAVRKPKASRSGSSEVFILGKSLKSA